MNPDINVMMSPKNTRNNAPAVAAAPGTLEAKIETVNYELDTLEALMDTLSGRLDTVSHTAAPGVCTGVTIVGEVLPPALDRLRFIAMRIANLNDRLRDQMDRLAL